MNRRKDFLWIFSDMILLLIAFFIFSVLGCKESVLNFKVQAYPGGESPHVFLKNKTNDLKQQTVILPGPDIKVVTGQEAVKPDTNEKNLEPAKDKPGAIAVKVQY